MSVAEDDDIINAKLIFPSFTVIPPLSAPTRQYVAAVNSLGREEQAMETCNEIRMSIFHSMYSVFTKTLNMSVFFVDTHDRCFFCESYDSILLKIKNVIRDGLLSSAYVHLVEQGINALRWSPSCSWNGKTLTWYGESTAHAHPPSVVIQELRTLLQELERAKVEVTLDVALTPEDAVVVVDDTCAVCLSAICDEDSGVRTRRCGHSFHRACLQRWVQTSSAREWTVVPSCPVCRTTFSHHITHT
jgi:hypothetical protein